MESLKNEGNDEVVENKTKLGADSLDTPDTAKTGGPCPASWVNHRDHRRGPMFIKWRT